MNRILIIESDLELAQRLRQLFTDMETDAFSCGSLRTAAAMLERKNYEVVIVDMELPDGDGFDVIQELGLEMPDFDKPSVILIMPNDKKPDSAKLRRQGIADCITKPFSTAVLKAKVWSQFQRRQEDFAIKASRRFEAIGAGTRSSIVGEHLVAIDDYTFNFDTAEYCIRGKPVRLNRLEQCLLRNLVENRGIVLKRKALTDKLMSESKIYIDGNMLAKTVKTLSERLGAQNYIKTVYGVGYIWTDAEDGGTQ